MFVVPPVKMLQPGTPDGQRGIAMAFLANLARIVIRVIRRYIRKREHGLLATTVEEILREFYVAEIGTLARPSLVPLMVTKPPMLPPSSPTAPAGRSSEKSSPKTKRKESGDETARRKGRGLSMRILIASRVVAAV